MAQKGQAWVVGMARHAAATASRRTMIVQAWRGMSSEARDAEIGTSRQSHADARNRNIAGSSSPYRQRHQNYRKGGRPTNAAADKNGNGLLWNVFHDVVGERGPELLAKVTGKSLDEKRTVDDLFTVMDGLLDIFYVDPKGLRGEMGPVLTCKLFVELYNKAVVPYDTVSNRFHSSFLHLEQEDKNSDKFEKFVSKHRTFFRNTLLRYHPQGVLVLLKVIDECSITAHRTRDNPQVSNPVKENIRMLRTIANPYVSASTTVLKSLSDCQPDTLREVLQGGRTNQVFTRRSPHGVSRKFARLPGIPARVDNILVSSILGEGHPLFALHGVLSSERLTTAEEVNSALQQSALPEAPEHLTIFSFSTMKSPLTFTTKCYAHTAELTFERVLKAHPSVKSARALMPIPQFASWLLRQSDEFVLGLAPRELWVPIFKHVSGDQEPTDASIRPVELLKELRDDPSWVDDKDLLSLLKEPLLKLVDTHINDCDIFKMNRNCRASFSPIWAGDLSRDGTNQSYGILAAYDWHDMRAANNFRFVHLNMGKYPNLEFSQRKQVKFPLGAPRNDPKLRAAEAASADTEPQTEDKPESAAH